MIQHSVVSEHVTVSLFIEFEAEVHVIVSNPHRLLEAAYFLVFLSCHQQTGSCHAKHIIGHSVTPEIVIHIIRTSNQFMRRSNPQVGNTGMLYFIRSGIQKPCSNRTNARLHCLTNHLPKPALFKHLNVII